MVTYYKWWFSMATLKNRFDDFLWISWICGKGFFWFSRLIFRRIPPWLGNRWKDEVLFLDFPYPRLWLWMRLKPKKGGIIQDATQKPAFADCVNRLFEGQRETWKWMAGDFQHHLRNRGCFHQARGNWGYHESKWPHFFRKHRYFMIFYQGTSAILA